MYSKPYNILIAPLDWGIGHASRCVPIIKSLRASGCKLVVASNGRALSFLREAFPDLAFEPINAYNIRYSRYGALMLFRILWQIPRIIQAIGKEHKLLKDLVEKHSIDLIISDNRYGMYHGSVPSVIISHQLMLKLPSPFGFMEGLLHRCMGYFLKKHTECWVPDYMGADNLSGDLSHKYILRHPVFFIGPLTRFKKSENQAQEKKYDVLFMLSGPEPQRSIFEKLVLKQLPKTKLNAVVLRGLPDEKDADKTIMNTRLYAHLPDAEIQRLIQESRLVVARSGYSTVMDLVALNAKAILIPTPGQTEQIYLARYLFQKKMFLYASQNTFRLTDAMQKAAEFPFIGLSPASAGSLVHERIEKLLNTHYSQK